MIVAETAFASRTERQKPASALLKGSSAQALVEGQVNRTRYFSYHPTMKGPRGRAQETSNQPLEVKLFEALSAAKVWTSKVAMHLDRDARDRYFRQLDRLHDIDEWFGADSPLQLASYKGFIRFMLIIGGCSKPSIGLGPTGLLAAVWEVAGARLSIEFHSANAAAWIVSHEVNGHIERVAGSTVLDRLLTNLQPYDPKKWFNFVRG